MDFLCVILYKPKETEAPFSSNQSLQFVSCGEMAEKSRFEILYLEDCQSLLPQGSQYKNRINQKH